MMKEAIGVALTVEAAIEVARLELAAPEGMDVKVEVLETPVKKTLGLFGGSPARVRATCELPDPPGVSTDFSAPAAAPLVSPPVDFSFAQQYLDDVLRLMGASATVQTVAEGDGVTFLIDSSEDYGFAIGRRGETLDALQYLARLVVSRGAESYQRVSVNVGDYRERREQALRDLASRTAAKAKKFGRNFTLDPMTPFERRIVHTTIQEIEGVSSHSVGEDNNRRVVVAVDEAYRKPYTGNRNGFPNKNNNRSDPNNSRGGNRGNYNPPRGGYNNARSGFDNNRNAFDHSAPRRDPAPVRDEPSPRAPRSDVAGSGRYGKIEPRFNGEKKDNS
jgi:spoIIIJ-associated protein